MYAIYKLIRRVNFYSFSDVYSGYNGGGTTGASSSIRSRRPRGEKAITDIVNPSTGKNISHEIYDDDATVESTESSNRETPQLQVRLYFNYLP